MTCTDIGEAYAAFGVAALSFLPCHVDALLSACFNILTNTVNIYSILEAELSLGADGIYLFEKYK
jgi:hypothetical protein